MKTLNFSDEKRNLNHLKRLVNKQISTRKPDILILSIRHFRQMKDHCPGVGPDHKIHMKTRYSEHVLLIIYCNPCTGKIMFSWKA